MSCEELQDLMLSGVVWEINESPITPTQAEPVAQPVAKPGAYTQTTIVPPVAPVQSVSLSTASAMAARPGDIDSLCRMIDGFNHPLRRFAVNVVLPHIAPEPNGVMILTDMPGAEDDATGKILSGAPGETIDKMLSAIGMSRTNVTIVPMLFWRTPGGRTPTNEEIALARPFVDRIIEMVKPSVVLTLGTLPASEFGHVRLPGDHGTPVDTPYGAKLVPIYHPNYLALKPSVKRDVWNALQNIQNLLKRA